MQFKATIFSHCIIYKKTRHVLLTPLISLSFTQSLDCKILMKNLAPVLILFAVGHNSAGLDCIFQHSFNINMLLVFSSAVLIFYCTLLFIALLLFGLAVHFLKGFHFLVKVNWSWISILKLKHNIITIILKALGKSFNTAKKDHASLSFSLCRLQFEYTMHCVLFILFLLYYWCNTTHCMYLNLLEVQFRYI